MPAAAVQVILSVAAANGDVVVAAGFTINTLLVRVSLLLAAWAGCGSLLLLESSRPPGKPAR